MRYYPALLPCKLDSIWTGPYLIVATLGWTVGIQRHPDEPVIFIHCQDVKKIPPLSGVQSWLTIPLPGGTPAVPMLGANTVAHTSRDSPSVTALPPDEGVELADVDSVQNGRSMSWHSESKHTSMPSEGGRRSLLMDSVVPEAIPFATTSIWVNDTSTLHPFCSTQIGCGTRSIDDYCTCVQLQDGHLTGWSKIRLFVLPEPGRRKGASLQTLTFRGDNRWRRLMFMT